MNQNRNKRALLVGCNYFTHGQGESPEFPVPGPELQAPIHDVLLLRRMLVQTLGFQAQNITVLTDDPRHQGVYPTRHNILSEAKKLTDGAQVGDVLFFAFSGFGVQVDDMTGYQDEGYDEAILPADYLHGRSLDGGHKMKSVIVMEDLQDVLTDVKSGVNVTVLFDCDHAGTAIDTAGTDKFGEYLVRGVKTENVMCGVFGSHTIKTELASHNPQVWEDRSSQQFQVRRRHKDLMQIADPRRANYPTRQNMSRPTANAFCFSASNHGETAVEMMTRDFGAVHGVLSSCFARIMNESKGRISYRELCKEINKNIGHIKKAGAKHLDQEVVLTHRAGIDDKLLDSHVLSILPNAAKEKKMQDGPIQEGVSHAPDKFGHLGSDEQLPSHSANGHQQQCHRQQHQNYGYGHGGGYQGQQQQFPIGMNAYGTNMGMMPQMPATSGTGMMSGMQGGNMPYNSTTSMNPAGYSTGLNVGQMVAPSYGYGQGISQVQGTQSLLGYHQRNVSEPAVLHSRQQVSDAIHQRQISDVAHHRHMSDPPTSHERIPSGNSLSPPSRPAVTSVQVAIGNSGGSIHQQPPASVHHRVPSVVAPNVWTA